MKYKITMNLSDPKVLDMVNGLISSDRLNKSQTLQIVNLLAISSNLKELRENSKSKQMLVHQKLLTEKL